jgi:LysM repeat protein
MPLILRHELQCEPEGCTVIIHIDPLITEFSKEFDGCNPLENKSFIELIQCYVKENFPDIHIKVVKIMIGSIVIATVSFSGIVYGDISASSTTYGQTAYTSYTVIAGDNLWLIANKFGTTVNEIKTINNLTTDSLLVGQVLKVSQPAPTYITYKVTSGDSLYIVAKRFNVTIATIKTLNNLTTETINIGQILKIPTTPTPTPAPVVTTTNYTVVSGDTLWIVASKFKTTIDNIKNINSLTTDMLFIGQVLKVPTEPTSTPAPTPAPVPQAPTISYITHKVVAGDNPWSLGMKYGIPLPELLSVNGFTQSTMLNIGQEVKIPVHYIPIRSTPGPQYGERLDWWTEAQYVFPTNKTAKITDFATGRSFNIKRTTGANHADCEPLTAADAAIMKEVWGGAYSWTTRAVIVEVDGRRIAGSIASMPHDVEYIIDNDFSGHFDLHFLNSTRHKDGLVDPYHQKQINIAAGFPQ